MENYFSKNLKYLRNKKELTQNELVQKLNKAYNLDIKEATIGHWETGKRTPKIETIINVADYFSVGSSIVFEDIKNNKTSPKNEEEEIKELKKIMTKLGFMSEEDKDISTENMKRFFEWYKINKDFFK